MKKLIVMLMFLAVFVFAGCTQNIPWEQRWANDYCNTVNWSDYQIDPASTSNLCALAEKYQITLSEAQGVIFWMVALGSITDETLIDTIGEYTLKAETYLQTPSLSLAQLFAMVVADSKDPRYAMLGNLINYTVFTYWGKDPIANLALGSKDVWFLKAHLTNVRNMIGYSPTG